VSDLTRINVLSGLVGAALWLWGDGLLALVLVAPIATFLLGHHYVACLGPPAGPPARLPELAREWVVMVRLGSAFLLDSVIRLTTKERNCRR
jgi:PST family polysaccharide transporter